MILGGRKSLLKVQILFSAIENLEFAVNILLNPGGVFFFFFSAKLRQGNAKSLSEIKTDTIKSSSPNLSCHISTSERWSLGTT